MAGDSLALIETDKASMDFEAQDDGVVAKLLVAEGGGEIECGTPIMVTVEEEGDVASFANFVADASPAAAVESDAGVRQRRTNTWAGAGDRRVGEPGDKKGAEARARAQIDRAPDSSKRR